jgi:hypothetical protein
MNTTEIDTWFDVDGAEIIVDVVKGTLRPREHTDAILLGVGYSADDTTAAREQRERRQEAERFATATYGDAAVDFGWSWLTHDGHNTIP